jgi:hypothetical protein
MGPSTSLLLDLEQQEVGSVDFVSEGNAKPLSLGCPKFANRFQRSANRSIAVDELDAFEYCFAVAQLNAIAATFEDNTHFNLLV